MLERTFGVESIDPRFSCPAFFDTLEKAKREAQRRVDGGAFSAAVYDIPAGEFTGPKVWETAVRS